MNPTPPKYALKLLRWFCSEDRLEELEGDLYEVFMEEYKTAPKKARRKYWWMVITGLRSYARKQYQIKNSNSMSHLIYLLRHHLKVSVRQMWKHKTTSAINILGLSIGIGTFVTIISFINHENSYNKHIPDSDKIYRVYTSFEGAFSGTNHGVAAGIPGFLKDHLPAQLEAVSGFHTEQYHASPNNSSETFTSVNCVISDPDYFSVFQQYDWLAGDPSSSLGSPNQVVITKGQATKYFGPDDIENYLGEKINYNDSLTTYVSGIIEQKPGNTDFDFTDFISLETVNNSWLKNRIDLTNWDNTNSSSQLWIRGKHLLSEHDLDAITTPIDDQSAALEEDKNWIAKYKTAPLSSMHFDQQLSLFDNSGRSAANRKTLNLMAVISIAILFLAIFNFINLEIAQIRGKVKEVGVRKVLGSNKRELMQRFLTASLLTTTIAGLVAIPLAFYGLLFFESFLPMELEVVLQDYDYPWIIILTILGVGIFSGAYPALLLSKYSPEQAFKAKALSGESSHLTSYLRKSFVSLQFVSSQLLIIGSIIIYLQLDFMRTKEVGFNTENIMYIYNDWRAPKVKNDLLFNELSQIPELTKMINQLSPPASNSYSSSIYTFQGEDEEINTNVYNKKGGADYLSFYDIEIIAGSNVTPSKESREIIINDTYRKELGFASPSEAVGKTLKVDSTGYVIKGVMEDVHTWSLANKIYPLAFSFSESKYSIAAKFLPENMKSMIDKVTTAYKKVYPNQSADIKFVDETLINFYESEQQMSQLSGFATIIAVLISCMGLFGLISLNIEHRTKEIGIRKVLGAGQFNIARLISREFILLLLLSLVITVPIVHFFAKEWLSYYAYTISLSPWIYAGGALISILIAILIISTKISQASRSNPVDSLRYE